MGGREKERDRKREKERDRKKEIERKREKKNRERVRESVKERVRYIINDSIISAHCDNLRQKSTYPSLPYISKPNLT